MKQILCFGDSNTYGLKPDGTGRFDFAVRYPGRLQAILGDSWRVIEEGCPGRTTIFEDKNRPYKKGLDYITPCLQSHTPLDFVVVMLGTNDCKTAFAATSKEIASGLSLVLARIQEECGPSGRCGSFPKIVLVSPVHLGEDIGQPGYDPEFDRASVQTSKGLAFEYHLLAQKTGSLFLNAAEVAQPSPFDQEHLDEEGHRRLAEAIAKIIMDTEE